MLQLVEALFWLVEAVLGCVSLPDFGRKKTTQINLSG